MDEQIRNADAKFDMEETSDELLDTWSAEEEQQRNEREYYRDRLASETGIDVLDAHVYENKGDNAWTADFACSQCGKFGVSIHEEFLPIGRCCYCGWDNELEKCDRCGQLVDVDVLENGLCPSCSAYVDKQ